VSGERGRVETTTRRAFAAPLRLGSIRARDFRRHSSGTGPFDRCRARPPRSPLAAALVHRRIPGDV